MLMRGSNAILNIYLAEVNSHSEYLKSKHILNQLKCLQTNLFSKHLLKGKESILPRTQTFTDVNVLEKHQPLVSSHFSRSALCPAITFPGLSSQIFRTVLCSLK